MCGVRPVWLCEEGAAHSLLQVLLRLQLAQLLLLRKALLLLLVLKQPQLGHQLVLLHRLAVL